MIDITKYNKAKAQWGETPPDVRGEMKLAHGSGEPIQVYYKGRWQACANPGWHGNCIYRVKPQSKPRTDIYNKRERLWRDLSKTAQDNIVAAWRAGEPIQGRCRNSIKWTDLEVPSWGLYGIFRVNPEHRTLGKKKAMPAQGTTFHAVINGVASTITFSSDELDRFTGLVSYRAAENPL
jgi:hypothetical protein